MKEWRKVNQEVTRSNDCSQFEEHRSENSYISIKILQIGVIDDVYEDGVVKKYQLETWG